MSTQNEKLLAAYELLSVLCRDVSDTMPIRQALAFVAVARRVKVDGQADLRDIGKDIEAVPAVVSRDLLALGIRGRNGRDGLDLVEVRQDMRDLRRRPYILTDKGDALLDKLLDTVPLRTEVA